MEPTSLLGHTQVAPTAIREAVALLMALRPGKVVETSLEAVDAAVAKFTAVGAEVVIQVAVVAAAAEAAVATQAVAEEAVAAVATAEGVVAVVLE